MSYKITIEKTETREVKSGESWEVVEHDDNGKGVFGYTPKIMREKEISVRVYEQVIENLNLCRVIGAINPPPTQGNSPLSGMVGRA
jgi:hypothetical protein